jgi:CDGSH-type Zn-finger protein/uncharacterized Fe-S cluster protein YjdI
MLRLLAYSFTVRRPAAEKALAVDLAIGLMRAMSQLAERAARLPAGPSNPDCNAGMSFTALRDAAPLLPGASAHRYFTERLGELASAAAACANSADARAIAASRMIAGLAQRGARGFAAATTELESRMAASAVVTGAITDSARPVQGAPSGIPIPTVVNGTEHIEGQHLTLLYETKKCIHARFCVTGAPKVFLANVKGPWIDPDGTEVDKLVEIAHACPSGAIRYARKDGKHDEVAPEVNLIAIREAGPYAVRAPIVLNGEPAGFRATLCRCGASKNKPFCDGSHHEAGFAASGEPPTGKADMLAVRDGELAIDPLVDGPLQVRGNLEITSGTGRVVARVMRATLCRCGGSNTKPFCDGTHARIGFKAD